ncbi:MAG: hypothetical protein ACLTZT_12635 [Butyricimonas faecalis]
MRPFVVETERQTVTVLGTEFNVRPIVGAGDDHAGIGKVTVMPENGTGAWC